MDSADVMEEVEALFKKLQDLPDNVRQKAFTSIHNRLPTFPGENDARPKRKRGRPRKKSPGEQEAPMTDITVKSTQNDRSEDNDELVVNAVQTSRGRMTTRISFTSLMKSGRRAAGSLGKMKKNNNRKKPKMEEELKIISVIKTEILDREELEENNYDDTMCVTPKEEKLSDVEADKNYISAVVEGFDSEAPPSENIESSYREESLINNEAEEHVQSGPKKISLRGTSSPVKRGLPIQSRARRRTNLLRTHKCPECGRSFVQSSGLQMHLKRHRGERNFACSDCPYRAFTKLDLLRHTTVHTGERNHVCQYCGKAYTKDSTLRDHVTSMHERKVKHICGECGFVTHRANNLRVHIKMRHHGEYNNHVCPVCQASIKQKSAFLEHMRSHTGERPYQCDKCPAAFACTARLNVHRNAVHGERQFKCEHCQKDFQTKHHLLRHEAIHTKARPFACPFCSYASNTQGNTTKHVRTIHKMPDYSYRKYKVLQENGGQPRPLDPDWVEKGNKLTEQYLKQLSEKIGRPITIEELWKRQEELRLQKLKASEHSYHSKTHRGKLTDVRAAVDSSQVEQLCDGPLPMEHEGGGEEEEGENQQEEEEEEKHPSVFNWLTNSANIQLCLETEELQVYTGDATREAAGSNKLETIHGYMNEQGHFIRFNGDVVVNDDDSTVVVIINSEDMEEAVSQSNDVALESSEVKVTTLSPDQIIDTNRCIILQQQES